MFTNITWTNYFTVTVLLTTVYYAFIAVRFYQMEIKTILQKLKTAINGIEGKPEEHETNHDGDNPEVPKQCVSEGDPFHDVEDLVSRLKEAIKVASNRKAVKAEFSQYLYLILKEFPELKKSPFQSAINELIISECAKYGSIILSEEEAVKLWDKV